MFSSSRAFPGRSNRPSAATKSRLISRSGPDFKRSCLRAKCWTSSARSQGRPRNGGIWTSNTHSRWNRSTRNLRPRQPCAPGRFVFQLQGFSFCLVCRMAAPFQSNEFIARHVRQVPRSGIREFFDIVQSMPEVISLGVGEPDFVTPWHIREAAIYALERGKTSYTSNLGLLKLREAISSYAERSFGVAYDPGNQILVTVGVSEALDIALRAVVNPGDEVLYHEPCYVSYSPSVALAHGVAAPVACSAERGFALEAEAIEKVATPRSKVLVLNFPTNPTGGT